MFTCRIDEDVELRLLDVRDASVLFALVDANRLYLRKWLPWLDSNREEQDSKRFIEWSRCQFAENKDVVTGIWYRGMLVGVIGLHGISLGNRSASVGYWVAEEFQGRGIVTRATRAILDYAFKDLGLHRVEIRCALGNTASQGVPNRLGFKQEGTLRQAERLYERYEDLVVYGILETEWPAPKNRT